MRTHTHSAGDAGPRQPTRAAATNGSERHVTSRSPGSRRSPRPLRRGPGIGGSGQGSPRHAKQAHTPRGGRLGDSAPATRRGPRRRVRIPNPSHGTHRPSTEHAPLLDEDVRSFITHQLRIHYMRHSSSTDYTRTAPEAERSVLGPGGVTIRDYPVSPPLPPPQPPNCEFIPPPVNSHGSGPLKP